MAEKAKVTERDKANMSARDKTLISILERMVVQLQKQDKLLDEVVKNQDECSRAVQSLEFQSSVLQGDNDVTLGKLSESLSRYRSDMLSLVNEQDHINANINELNKMINKVTYASENSNQMVVNMDERLKAQEKSVRNNFAHSAKQSETIQKEVADSTRTVTKLHVGTEKRLGEMHHETQHQLEKMRQETARRLLALDGIDAALQTLLVRTEPPEKKPLLVVRVFNRVIGLFRIKIPLLIKRIRLRMGDD